MVLPGCNIRLLQSCHSKGASVTPLHWTFVVLSFFWAFFEIVLRHAPNPIPGHARQVRLSRQS